VQNVIVCWNCLYLNQYLFQAPPAERQAVADAIAASSPVSWQHVNLHGEFDFSDEALKDSLRCGGAFCLPVGAPSRPARLTFVPKF